MTSLKAFLPVLSSLLELSPVALYERQRALVRLGLLPTPHAPGRNSGGAMATPDAAAIMVIALLATDNLSDMDSRIEALANLRAFDPKSGKATDCSITKEKTLRRALAGVLANPNEAKHLSIEVTRRAKTARIVDTSELKLYQPSQFGRPATIKGIEQTATIELFPLSRELEKVNK